MYGYKKEFRGGFEEAYNKAVEELKNEGFGVLTEIDVKEILKKKLNQEFENYKILGACNPSFAFEALKTEKDIGLMMPCNVIIFKDESKVFVSAILPSTVMSVVQNPKLEVIAKEVEEKLKKTIDKIVK